MRLLLVLLFCISLTWSFVPALRISEAGPRIIGGDIARAGQFPWQAALYLEKEDGKYFCSGTIISNQWILTAAHCVDRAIQITIQVGSNSLNGNDNNRLILSTSNYVIHPDFNLDTLVNDVGLIKLHMPIVFTEYIKKISIANMGLIREGITVTAAGWGQTSDNAAGLSNDLAFVTLSIISNTECQSTFGDQIKAGMVCAIGNYNEGICLGDTGGPLIRPGIKGEPLHVGIASFLSQNGCETPEPTGYTRTDIYHKWISNVTKTV